MININTPNTKHALNIHKKGLKGEIIKRARKRYKERKNSIKRIPFRKLIVFLEENENKILSSELSIVKELQEALFNKLGDVDNLNKDLEYIFNYKWFRGYKKNKYDGFKLAKALSIDVCPYCNRNYTTSHTVESTTKNVFPEFDHYYPKKKYPLLAVSFYNLIPSCNICNTHYKGEDDPDDENIYYPYSKYDAVKHFNFDFSPNDYNSLLGKSTNFEITICTSNTSSERIKDQITDSLKYFDITGIYENNHKGLIKSLINKRINYSDSYIQSLIDNFNITKEEAYHILFESFYENEKLSKRPFSKLKKDIFDEIESLSK